MATGDNPQVAERSVPSWDWRRRARATSPGRSSPNSTTPRSPRPRRAEPSSPGSHPEQKARPDPGPAADRTRSIGFLGDGVSDALALHSADVGISVDTATDIAKDAADVVLLEKNLGVLATGVAEGRRIFANTIRSTC